MQNQWHFVRSSRLAQCAQGCIFFFFNRTECKAFMSWVYCQVGSKLQKWNTLNMEFTPFNPATINHPDFIDAAVDKVSPCGINLSAVACVCIKFHCVLCNPRDSHSGLSKCHIWGKRKWRYHFISLDCELRDKGHTGFICCNLYRMQIYFYRLALVLLSPVLADSCICYAV